MNNTPLADLIRPKSLDDFVGQTHLLGTGKPLRRIIEQKKIPNMIFYGPSGVGKTTLARYISDNCNMTLRKLNGTSAGTANIKEIINEAGTFGSFGSILLYLDEIQYLNKKQQQSLLEFIENGQITLIASTTENPYFYVYGAIISRCTIFEFKPVSPEKLKPAIKRAFRIAGEYNSRTLQIEDGVIDYIASGCGGDVRKSINCAELCVLSAEAITKEETDTLEVPVSHMKSFSQSDESESIKDTDDKNFTYLITFESAKLLTQRSNMRYDRDGDEHYDILSAFQKSIRGSDENAALHYAARLFASGDMLSLCRRLMVIACEDIGLAYPSAISIVRACVESAKELGLPEARIPLAEAIILLCTAPKSNSGVCAIDAAAADVENGFTGDIPADLRDSHYGGAAKLGRGSGYKYPHDYPNHYTPQQYLPDPLKDRVYYSFGENKTEQAAKQYRDKIKGNRE
ncbi:MAG: replication-associated recombination protein A [Ruminococcus sp.]|jgi:putative ATPase|nr:replication-associated recombination protein A [Ruminococcus sp.]